MQEIKIENNIETRIDSYLAEYLDESRSKIAKMLKENYILVNNSSVKASYLLRENDVVTVKEYEDAPMKAEAEDMDLDIVYEDEDVLVVNKPKGMVVHPAAGHYTGTLVNALMYHCQGSLSGINGVMRPGIVHRIDMDTTGSIIICKNDLSHNHIAAQLKNHSVVRKYHAICHGVINEEDGTINAPIGRHNVDRKRMAVNERNGKEAITHYKVLERYRQYSYIECELETGRTHQIRVHMSSIGHPILGDSVYANNRKIPFKLEGQCLHAKTLGFIHPRTLKYIEIDSPLPEYFSHLLEVL